MNSLPNCARLVLLSLNHCGLAIALIGFGWLAEPSAIAAPVTVVIQPAPTEGKDTRISRGGPGTESRALENAGIQPELFVGQIGGNAGASPNGQFERSLIQFGLSSIPPGAEILSATLSLKPGETRSGTIEGYRLKVPWQEGAQSATPGEANWQFRLPNVAWSVSGFRATDGGGYHANDSEISAPLFSLPINATPDAFIALPLNRAKFQEWISSDFANNGLLLRLQEEGNGFSSIGFASSDSAIAADRPKLTVTYESKGATALPPAAPPALVAEDNVGYAVAVSGDWAVVGVPYQIHSNPSSRHGTAHVYQRVAGAWQHFQTLDGPGSDKFGTSVAIDGDTLVIGSGKDSSASLFQGSAFVFVRGAGGVWSLQQRLAASDGGNIDEFGDAVAISGNTIVIGAVGDDGVATVGNGQSGNDALHDQGLVYVFTRSGTVWTEEARFNDPEVNGFDYFGRSVAVDGNTIVVGSNEGFPSGGNQAEAYVFVKTGATWQQRTRQAKLTITAPGSGSGTVSIDGDRVALGAFHATVGANANQGKVAIYRRTGSTWSFEATLTGANGAANDGFGREVALSGDTLLVGTNAPPHLAAHPGRVHVFHRRGFDWLEDRTLAITGGVTGDQFGDAVALDGTTALVGAPFDDVAGLTDRGSVYVYELDPHASPAVPALGALSATRARPGDSITLTGTGFSAAPGENVVYFGAVRGTVTAASATSLTVTVPFGATHAPVTVTTGGFTTASRLWFTPASLGSGTLAFAAPAAQTGVGSFTYYQTQAIGDLDNDGWPDVVTFNTDNSKVKVMRNTLASPLSGNAAFPATVLTTAVTLDTPGAVITGAIGDVDGDGRQDIVTANYQNSTVSIFRNATTPGGAIAFAAPITLASGGTTVEGVAVADLDGDGRPEILAAHSGYTGSDDRIGILRNLSSPGVLSIATFEAPRTVATVGRVHKVAAADLNGDGRLDLICGSSSAGAGVIIVPNASTGPGNFTFGVNVALAVPQSVYSIVPADMDGDGRLDVLIGDYSGAGNRVLYNAHVSGTLAAASFSSYLLPGQSSPYMDAGDLNGDGKPDALGGSTGNADLPIRLNASPVAATPPLSFLLFTPTPQHAGNLPAGTNIVDLDRDGRNDLVSSGPNSGTVALTRNLLPLPVLPTATTGSATSLTSTGAQLNGAVHPNGSATTVRFEWGADATYGNVTADQALSGGASSSPVSAVLGGLQPLTTYHFRVVAVNAAGTTAGLDATFMTPATPVAPEISVEQPAGTPLADGSGSVAFGTVQLGANASRTFTIRNTGTANLTGLGITIDGANPNDFSVTASPAAPVAEPNGSTTFTVRFAPAAINTRAAVLHLTSNDADESPFDIALTGSGIDTLDPVITSPPNQTVTASEAGGAIVTYPPATATDNGGGTPAIVYSKASGTLFPIGVTTVTVTATDAQGNVATATFTVRVRAAGTTFLAESNAAVEGAGVPGSGIPAGAVWKSFGLPGLDGALPFFLGAFRSPGSGLQQGVFGAGGPQHLLAKTGDAAPGVDGGQFLSFLPPAGNGGTAFIGRMKAVRGKVSGTNDQGIWSNAGADADGALRLVAREGAATPGLTGVFYKAFTDVALNDGANLYWTATLRGARVASANDTALFAQASFSGGPQLLLREGDPVMIDGAPQRITAFFSLRAGPMTYGDRLPGGTAGFGDGRRNGGPLVPVQLVVKDGRRVVATVGIGRPLTVKAVTGGPVPGLAGVKWSTLGHPSAGGTGLIAFRGTLALSPGSGAVTRENAHVLFAEAPGGGPALLARQGEDAPDLPGLKYGALSDPCINAAGDVLYFARLTGSGVTAANNEALFWKREGQSARLVQRTGRAAPGINGALIQRFMGTSLPQGSGPDDPQGPVFLAQLKIGPGGVKPASRIGLWATDRTGTVRLLARVDTTVNDKTLRAIGAFQFVSGSGAQARTAASAPSAVYRATFTDRTTAIVEVPIP